jgi:hypothetical protein
MGDFTDHHCKNSETLLVAVSSLLKGAEPGDPEVPVKGNNAVTSQINATADPQSARLLPIPYENQGTRM